MSAPLLKPLSQSVASWSEALLGFKPLHVEQSPQKRPKIDSGAKKTGPEGDVFYPQAEPFPLVPLASSQSTSLFSPTVQSKPMLSVADAELQMAGGGFEWIVLFLVLRRLGEEIVNLWEGSSEKHREALPPGSDNKIGEELKALGAAPSDAAKPPQGPRAINWGSEFTQMIPRTRVAEHLEKESQRLVGEIGKRTVEIRFQANQIDMQAGEVLQGLREVRSSIQQVRRYGDVIRNVYNAGPEVPEGELSTRLRNEWLQLCDELIRLCDKHTQNPRLTEEGKQPWGELKRGLLKLKEQGLDGEESTRVSDDDDQDPPQAGGGVRMEGVDSVPSEEGDVNPEFDRIGQALLSDAEARLAQSSLLMRKYLPAGRLAPLPVNVFGLKFYLIPAVPVGPRIRWAPL